VQPSSVIKRQIRSAQGLCAKFFSHVTDETSSRRQKLKEAVQLALKQNPQVVALRLLSLESDRQRQISRSALLPQASLTSTGLLGEYNIASIERTNTRTASGIYQYIQAGPAYSQSLLNLPLFRRYQISGEGVREARAEEAVTREDVDAAVVTQYILVLRAFAMYDAAKSGSISPSVFTSKRRICRGRE
jgi:outer membrane protein TolC